MKVRRFDQGTLRSPQKRPNGWLQAEGFLTRVGVFTYRRQDGTTFRELRPPEEVFRADSLESLRQVPLTNGHPSEGDGLLTAENAKRYTVGNVGYGCQDASGFYVQGPLLVTDAQTVADIERGKAELSCGYTADLDPTPGEWMGQPYDAVQRAIVYNHVALVDKGRAGANVRIKLDTHDAEQLTDDTKPTKEHTVKIRIDGIDFDLNDSAAQAVEKERAALQAKLDAAEAKAKEATTEAAKSQARADAASEELKKALDPKALAARVQARAALEADARAVLGAEAKLDGLDDQSLRVEVLKTLRPETKLDGKSPEYLDAYYAATLDAERKGNPGLTRARTVAQPAPNAPSNTTPAPRTDAAPNEDEARKRMLAANRDAWKKTN